MKFIYQVLTIPWINSTLDVWEEGSETKIRMVIPHFQKPAGCAECLLKKELAHRNNLNPSEIEVERFIP